MQKLLKDKITTSFTLVYSANSINLQYVYLNTICLACSDMYLQN